MTALMDWNNTCPVPTSPHPSFPNSWILAACKKDKWNYQRLHPNQGWNHDPLCQPDNGTSHGCWDTLPSFAWDRPDSSLLKHFLYTVPTEIRMTSIQPYRQSISKLFLLYQPVEPCKGIPVLKVYGFLYKAVLGRKRMIDYFSAP